MVEPKTSPEADPEERLEHEEGRPFAPAGDSRPKGPKTQGEGRICPQGGVFP